MIKNRVNIDKKLLLEASNKYILIESIVMILGLIIFIFGLLFYFINNESLYLLLVVIGGVAFFGFLFMFISLMMNISNGLKKNKNSFIDIELYDDYLVAKTYQEENKVMENRSSYNDILFYKETSHFLFLYINKKHYYPLSKNEEVKELISLKIIKK